LCVAGGTDKYYASALSFLPRNIGSLHQPDMFPPAHAPATGTGGSTPIRDEEGGSTPVLDEPDDDDIPVAPRYSTPMVLASQGKPGLQPNLTGGAHYAGNPPPEFSYPIMRLNDSVVSSQRPDENAGSMAAPPSGSFGSDGSIMYRPEVVDGFQSASEAFHPPPDFFRSDADFNVPPSVTIYQMKNEGFVHASDSLPALAPSTRDVVYTVVTTVQQPVPASYYPVVIEVPSFTEPPPKLATFQPAPAPFVHPPPAIFNPSLPPPTLLQSNLPPPALPPAQPQPQPVSVQYTVPPQANIQVVVTPHTLRSPLPAPPKSTGLPPVYVSQQSISQRLSVPRPKMLHAPSTDRRSSATSYQTRFDVQDRARTLSSPTSDRKTTSTYHLESITQTRDRTLRSISRDENATSTSYHSESVMQGSARTQQSPSSDRRITTTYQPESIAQTRDRTPRSMSTDENKTASPYQLESIVQGRATAFHSPDSDRKTTSTYQPESEGRARTPRFTSRDDNITSTSYQPESIVQGKARTLHSLNSDVRTTGTYQLESQNRARTLNFPDDGRTYQPESATQARARRQHSTCSDDNTVTTSYQPESIMQGIRNIREHEQKDKDNSVASGIRHIRESQEKDTVSNITSIVSAIPTVGMSGNGQVHTPQRPTQQISPVAGQQIPSLFSLNPPPPSAEVVCRMSKSFMDDDTEPSASAAFSSNKRRLSVSNDSLSNPEAAKILHESKEEPDVGLTSENAADQSSDADDVSTEEFAAEMGNDDFDADDDAYDAEEDSAEQQIPSFVFMGRRPHARFGFGGRRPRGPRLFGIQRPRVPFPRDRPPFPVGVQPRMPRNPRLPRIPRIPRVPRGMFRGQVQFWGGGY